MDGTLWCKLRIKQMSYRYKYIDYTYNTFLHLYNNKKL